MTSSPVSVVVVSAGVSTPSSTTLLAQRIGQSVVESLRVRDVAVELTFIDVRELGMDLTSAVLTAGRRSAAVERANTAVAQADAVIAATPVFAASYSGLFKSFFDVLDAEALRGTPVLIAATAGSQRHSLVLDHAMRPLFAYFGATVLATGVFAATADFGAATPDAQALSERIGRAAEELSRSVVLSPSPGPDADRLPARGADDLSSAESLEAAGVLPDFGALLPSVPRPAPVNR
ncbi:MAG: CE1759 family FMN reductase [Ornithinimicrobium sp.]